MLGHGAPQRRAIHPGTGKKLRSRAGALELFLYRLAAHHRIIDAERLKDQITIDQVKRWLAFYRIEPFGNAWLRTARAANVVAAAFGAKVGTDFEDKFLPTYDPMRVMTDEEIMAELMKIPGAKLQAH